MVPRAAAASTTPCRTPIKCGADEVPIGFGDDDVGVTTVVPSVTSDAPAICAARPAAGRTKSTARRRSAGGGGQR
ncbi:hypothetical protein HPP92_016467 [Vanilla planifolia]|uniref:Uncharacterized protein n=1 Tax=Vanilla planifolia TaxID=51239 RepID=A0A835QET9_VANPL|nr:hypothetical protein HPP92_016467 [Vanilla planifolia]